MKVVLALCFAAILIGCVSLNSGEEIRVEEQIVATVNREQITVENLRTRFSRSHSGHMSLIGGISDREAFLDVMIIEYLMTQEAYRIGLDRDSSLIANVDRYREDRIIERLRDDEVHSEIHVTDEEIAEVYEKYYGTKFDLSLIRLPTEAEAMASLEELKSNRSFAQVARERSIDASASKGGRIRSVIWGMLEPELEKVVFSMKVGEVSGVIGVPGGFYIAQLNGAEDFVKKKLEKAEVFIRSTLEKRQTADRYRNFASDIKGQYEVVIDGEALHSEDDDAVVLRINGETALTAGGFRDLKSRTLAHMKTLRPGDLLEDFVERELLRREALKRDYDRNAEVIEEVKKYERALLLNRIYEEISDSVRLEADEVRAYYESHKEEFREPDKAKIRHIVVKTAEEAEEILGELGSGSGFEQLARERSVDFAAPQGGDLGYVVRGKLVKEFDDAAFSLAVGETSGIVKTRFGYHIIKLEEIIRGELRPFTAVEDDVRELLLISKRKEERNRWAETLRSQATIEIDRDLLAKIEF